MAYETLLFDRDDSVATITFNRPEALNALSEVLIRECSEALVTCEYDPDIRTVVITGNGRAFCAGGDIREQNAMARGEGSSPAKFAITQWAHDRMVLPLRRMGKPVIAAINGVCVGGGLAIALACDLRIAAAEARFRMSYAGVGVSPDAGTTYNLPRLVGHAKAMELYLLDEFLSAQEALRIGLVNEVVPGSELPSTVQEMAKRLAAGPTFAYGQTKTLLNRSFINDFAAQLSEEARSLGLCAGTADHSAAVEAFLAKRQARFNGR